MRKISWVKAAWKEFHTFPQAGQEKIKFALEIAASGEMADTVKPMKGFDAGVLEVALAHRADAFRTVYALKLGETSGWCMPSRRSSPRASRPRNGRSMSSTNASNE